MRCEDRINNVDWSDKNIFNNNVDSSDKDRFNKVDWSDEDRINNVDWSDENRFNNIDWSDEDRFNKVDWFDEDRFNNVDWSNEDRFNNIQCGLKTSLIMYRWTVEEDNWKLKVVESLTGNCVSHIFCSYFIFHMLTDYLFAGTPQTVLHTTRGHMLS